MPRPLRVGVQLPEVERIVRWPEYEAMARAAEEVGFDSIWVGDHLLYRDEGRPERGPWDVWTVIAALAAVTERVVIGPLVACLGFNSPGQVARMTAAIDEISGGRFVLGVGSGWNEPEFRAFGLPFDHRASRFLESFEIIRRLLAGEHVTSEGRFWQVEDAVLLPPPARRTPIMLGTSGPRQLAATLPHADSWNTWWDAYGNTAEGFVAVNAGITAIAESAGRDPAEVERSACVLIAFGSAACERPRDDDAPPLTGDPATIAHALRDLAEAGADEAILVLDPISEATVRQCGEVLAALDA
jgi:alkanesulfonate monooxygenase SsuD/methylene tetrahydromethanopterin reductase-like flavin-dependent oxidoreductase (luciferase family)